MRKLYIPVILLSLLASSVWAGFSEPIKPVMACRADYTQPNNNVHDKSKLTVRADVGLKSWIRFDLNGVDMTGVRAAKLTLTLMEPRYSTTSVDISAVNDDCHDNDGWNDTDITWNNAPGNDTSSLIALDAAKTTYLSSVSFETAAAGDSFEVDVSAAILADTDGNVQIILHNGVGGVINFATWDHATTEWQPYLVLEYTPAGADYPVPDIGATVTSGLSNLSWDIPEPNVSGTPIYCDVYLGYLLEGQTEPNIPQMDKLTLADDVEMVDINTTNFPTYGSLISGKTYYWFVDIHDPGRTPNPVPGEMWSFTVDDNVAPEVYAGADQILWGVPKEVTLDATVTDDGLPTPSTLTYTWSRTSGPTSIVINSPNTEDTTLTITERGDYRLLLTVSDGAKFAVDTIQVVVGTDACDASHIDTGRDYNAADQNQDCIVDMEDLMTLIVTAWLNCTDSLTDCGS